MKNRLTSRPVVSSTPSTRVPVKRMNQIKERQRFNAHLDNMQSALNILRMGVNEVNFRRKSLR